MPIARHFRQFYGRAWRKEIRPRILTRALDACEHCRVPNNSDVVRNAGWWLRMRLTFGADPETVWIDEQGRPQVIQPALESNRYVRIVLTVAHLNHTPGDDRDENLKALCQWCHLNYDKLHHHETRAARKDECRPLFTNQKEHINGTRTA